MMRLFLLGSIPLAIGAAALVLEQQRGLSRRRLIHGAVVFSLGFLAGFPLYLIQVLLGGLGGGSWTFWSVYQQYLYEDYLFFTLLSGLVWLAVYGRRGARPRRFSSCRLLESMAWLSGGLFFLSLGEFFLMAETLTVYEILYAPLLRASFLISGGVLLYRTAAAGQGKGWIHFLLFAGYSLLLPLVPAAILWNRPAAAAVLCAAAAGTACIILWIFTHKKAVPEDG